MSHVTRTPGQKVKGQLDDVLNSKHAVTGATWRRHCYAGTALPPGEKSGDVVNLQRAEALCVCACVY